MLLIKIWLSRWRVEVNNQLEEMDLTFHCLWWLKTHFIYKITIFSCDNPCKFQGLKESSQLNFDKGDLISTNTFYWKRNLPPFTITSVKCSIGDKKIILASCLLLTWIFNTNCNFFPKGITVHILTRAEKFMWYLHSIWVNLFVSMSSTWTTIGVAGVPFKGEGQSYF